MTKHEELDRTIVCNGSVKSQFGESYDCIASDLKHKYQRAQDAFALKGLSISELYIKRRVRIAFEFGSKSIVNPNSAKLIAVFGYNRNVFKTVSSRRPGGIDNFKPFDSQDLVGGDQGVMLIGDIELVDAVKTIPSALEGLYHVNNKSNNGITRGAHL